MRIDELEKEVEILGRIYNIGLRVRQTTKYIFIDRFEPENLYTIAQVGLDEEYIINTDDSMFNRLPKKFKKELFNILVKFARNPEKEREEEKRYRYRLKSKYLWIDKRLNLANCYLNIQSFQDGSEQKVLDNRGNTNSFKAEFTDEEIKEVAEKFDVDLEMFDKIEVEDD